MQKILLSPRSLIINLFVKLSHLHSAFKYFIYMLNFFSDQYKPGYVIILVGLLLTSMPSNG